MGAAPARISTRTLLELRWSAQDPLAVGLEMMSQPAHPALPHGSWVVLRDFLRYGCEEPTGDGDVRVEPRPVRGTTEPMVSLTLLGGPKPYTVEVPRAVLCDFLDRTDREVPAGTEAPERVLDELVERLLTC